MAVGEIALHDRVEIDGTDWSTNCRGANAESSNTQIEASGFSVSGTEEYLDGPRASALVFTFKYTEALNAALWPIHRDREVVAVEWQPHGLIDTGREIWYGNCSLPEYPPEATRGDLRIVTVRFTPGDSDGIRQYAAS
jgi:hypothetical protein